MRRIVLALCACLVASPAIADVTIEDYQRWAASNDDNGRTIQKAYMIGLWEGVWRSNTAYPGGDRRICFPNEVITPKQFGSIVDAELAVRQAYWDKHKQWPFTILVFSALERAYPCK